MKKVILIMFTAAFVFTSYTSYAELTDAQKAEQRRQQQSAQSAYQASANTYDEVSRTAETYKEGAEIVRDTTKQVGETALKYSR